MKKQTKKLTLNKKTISNLTATEMSKHVGASYASCSGLSHCHECGGGNTKNGNTCPGHKTCYNC